MVRCFTKHDMITDMVDKNRKNVDFAQQRYIEWEAAGNIAYWRYDDRIAKRPSLSELSRELGYSRQTMYNWKRNILDFKERVDEARKGLWTDRESVIWNGLFLKAATGDVRAAEMVLSNFTDYNPIKYRRSTRLRKNGDNNQRSDLQHLLKKATNK